MQSAGKKQRRTRSDQRADWKSGRETSRSHKSTDGKVQRRGGKDAQGKAKVPPSFLGIRDIVARGKFPVFLRDENTGETWIILSVHGEWVRYWWLDDVRRNMTKEFGPGKQTILWQPK